MKCSNIGDFLETFSGGIFNNETLIKKIRGEEGIVQKRNTKKKRNEEENVLQDLPQESRSKGGKGFSCENRNRKIHGGLVGSATLRKGSNGRVKMARRGQ